MSIDVGAAYNRLSQAKPGQISVAELGGLRDKAQFQLGEAKEGQPGERVDGKQVVEAAAQALMAVIANLLSGEGGQPKQGAPVAANAPTAKGPSAGNDLLSRLVSQATDPEGYKSLNSGRGLTSDQNNAQLNESLEALGNDPEGKKLLDEAKRRGVKIRVGDPGHPDALGVYKPDSNEIIIRPNANKKEFLKTLVHELTHAVTPENGNSQDEEGKANVIGERVASRITGVRSNKTPQQIYQDTLGLYPELKRSNGQDAALGRYGISAIA